MNTSDNGKCPVYRTDFDPSEIPADLREFFVEVSAACGAPWVRQVRKSGGTTGKGWHDHTTDMTRGRRGGNDGGANEAAAGWYDYSVTTTGWTASCACDAAVVPCRVLDPFAGAGTTLLVADRLQRDAIGIELSTAYSSMATERVVDDAPLLAWLAEAAE